VFLDASLKNDEQVTMLQTLKPLKEIAELMFALIYAVFLLVIRKDASRVVLYYHSINKADINRFRNQMAYLARRCTVVKASNIMVANTNGAKSVIAITFDDAFVNVRENAIPVLKEHRLPASVFVPVADIGQRSRWEMLEDYADKDEFVMNRQEILELDKDGFDIYSHTLSHPRLTELNEDKLLIELRDSKQTLEKIVGHEVIGISYPYGSHDNRVCYAAEKCGYRLGFTIEPNTVNNATGYFRIGRFSVSPKDSLIKFRLKVSGAYQVVKYLRAVKKLLFRFEL
jgi:peptidoglycan/xylan/chitin deacetylase (PgdA/CDA1 family)